MTQDRRVYSSLRQEINKLNTEEQEQLWFRDPLTDCLNRWSYNVVTSRKEFVGNYLMLDIDSFKFINDTYGHLAGDKLLRILGACLTTCFTNLPVYRYGGDEFVVDLSGTIYDNSLNWIQKASVLAPYINTSGIFSYGIGSTFREADDNLYDSKKKRTKQSKRAWAGQPPAWSMGNLASYLGATK